MNTRLEAHLRELQRVIRLRHVLLQRAYQGGNLCAERDSLTEEYDILTRRLEERLLYEEIGDGRGRED